MRSHMRLLGFLALDMASFVMFVDILLAALLATYVDIALLVLELVGRVGTWG